MTNKSWLALLEQATSYRELQSVFSQMAAEANSTSDAMGLSESIDEAIRRIEQERARDSSELATFTAEYDSFKSEQSGVIGWFKRKLPFTETRKQELKHRGSVDEQRAEILADNFVIARAQMLKERIVPSSSSSRRMGQRPQEWRDNLLRHESAQDIRVYGKSVSELSREIPIARMFAESVRTEIDAFSSAIFTDKLDRTQRDADLLAAQNEVKSLEDEVRDKESLRKSAITRIAVMIQDELIANDPAFRTLASRFDQLKGVAVNFANVKKVAEEFHSHLETVCRKLTELQTIPTQRDSLDKKMHKLQGEFRDSEYQRNNATDALREPSRLFETASRELSNTKASLDAAKRIYDAYLTEQSKVDSNKAEVTSDFDYDGTSPVVAEYGRLKAASSQAEENLRRVTPTFENAKRLLDQVTQQTNSIRTKVDEANSELSKLEDKQSQITKQVNATRENLSRVKAALRSELRTYATHIQGINWLENFRFLAGVPTELVLDGNRSDILPDSLPWSRNASAPIKSQELAEFQEQLELISSFEKTLKSDKTIVDKDFPSVANARKEALIRRCQLLLENDIANELHFE